MLLSIRAKVLSVTVFGWLSVGGLAGLPCRGEEQPNPLAQAFAVLRSYEWGPQRDALLPIDIAVNASFGNTLVRQKLEEQLLEVLATDAPRAAKDYVCRQLSVMGTSRSVVTLDALLSDPQLAHVARRALEKIPGPEASTALRQAATRAAGDQRLGAIHSLGVRGDMEAVELLSELLRDPDARVVAASIAALGRISGPVAQNAVTSFLAPTQDDVPVEVADAALRVATQFMADGKTQEAASIYQRFEDAEAEQLRCAAFQGLLRAEPDQAVARYLAALARGPESWRRFVAQVIARQADEEQVAAICSAWTELPGEGRLCVLEAMSARPHGAMRGVALDALAGADASLYDASVRVLSGSGERDDVPTMMRFACGRDAAMQEAVVEAVAKLKAAGLDESLVALLESPESELQRLVIRALVARQSVSTSGRILELARHGDASVRLEALTALQTLPDASLAEPLVAILVRTQAGKERDAAERAVARCCALMAPPAEQAEPLLKALLDADTKQRAAILPALGRIGGTEALQAIEHAMSDADAELRDAAVRGLCNWPDPTVAPKLLELARSTSSETHRIRALRGYARVVVLDDTLPPAEITAGLRQAMQWATRLEDKRLVLSRLEAVRCPEALAWAVSMVDDPELGSEALNTIVALAEGMKKTSPQVAEDALKRVAGKTQDPELQLYVAKLLWNMQLKQTPGQE